MEDKILKEISELLAKPVGAQFYKVNLHVHTGASGDWNSQENQTVKREQLTAQHIVNAAKDAQLDMIAITDHNTVQWVEDVKYAARKMRKETGYDLVVLPGVEISTHEGIHIQGIFDPDKPVGDLDLMLKNIGLKGVGTTNDATNIRLNLLDVMTRIHDEGGVVIAPHAKSRNGILTGRGDMQELWLNSGLVDIIALDESSIIYYAEEDRHLPAGKNPTSITMRHAYINVSDSSRLEDIGVGVTWLLLGSRSAQGLKQIVCEPRRISRTEPSRNLRTSILGLSIDGGYFDGQFIGFSDRLTTIIGGNYSGKSSIFDLIRFAVDDIPSSTRQRYFHRLAGILQSGSVVRLYFTSEGRLFVSSRTLDLEIDAIKNEYRSLREYPSTFEYVEGKLIPSDEQLKIEIYEQGEVSKIREQSANQLGLIDRQIDIEDVKRDLILAQRKLEINSKELAPLYGEIEQLEQEIQKLAHLEATSKELEQSLQDVVFQDDSKWRIELEYLTRIKRLVEQEKKLVEEEATADRVGTARPDQVDIVHANEIEEISQRIENYANQLDNLRVEKAKLVSELEAGLEGIFVPLRESHRERGTVLHERLVELGLPSKEKISDRLNELRVEIGKIQFTEMPRLEKQKTKLTTLESSRKEMMVEFIVTRETLYQRRLQIVNRLNDELGDTVRLELTGYGETGEYLQTLQDACREIASSATKIRDRDQQLSLVASTIAPSDLVRHIIEKDHLRKCQETSPHFNN